MNMPKLAERYLLLKNSLTRNIRQVFVTWKSLKMGMKTKGFMIRIRDEKNFVLKNPKEKNNSPFSQTSRESLVRYYNFVITIFLGLGSHTYVPLRLFWVTAHWSLSPRLCFLIFSPQTLGNKKSWEIEKPRIITTSIFLSLSNHEVILSSSSLKFST